jgi:transposase
MIESEHLPMLSCEDLLGLVAELPRQIAAMTASHEALLPEIDQPTWGEKREAALFSRDTHVAEPKPPGRKPGAGTFRIREIPPREPITEPPVEVGVFLDT